MIKRERRFGWQLLIILALWCLTATACAESKVSLHDYLPYENGKTTITWDIIDDDSSRYVVTYKVIDNGTAIQSELEAGRTYGNSVETNGIIPGKCYEIAVKDLSGTVLSQKAYRMDEAETFEDGKLKNTSIKIYVKPTQMKSGKEPSGISALKATDIVKGFSDGSVYYGVQYKMAMPQVMKERTVFVTLAFESPDGYVYVDKATTITFDEVRKANETVFWRIAGADFFWQLYKTNNMIPVGKYSIYLFWDGKWVNTTQFTVK